jgi:hypothetical protein
VPELNSVPDFGAEVAAHRKSKKRPRATGAEVVMANADLWEGYARVGAQLELAVARITQIHNEGAAADDHVNVITVKRAFQQIHRGWKAFRKALDLDCSPDAPDDIESSSPGSAPSIALSDQRPVGGRTFGEPTA